MEGAKELKFCSFTDLVNKPAVWNHVQSAAFQHCFQEILLILNLILPS